MRNKYKNKLLAELNKEDKKKLSVDHLPLSITKIKNSNHNEIKQPKKTTNISKTTINFYNKTNKKKSDIKDNNSLIQTQKRKKILPYSTITHNTPNVNSQNKEIITKTLDMKPNFFRLTKNNSNNNNSAKEEKLITVTKNDSLASKSIQKMILKNNLVSPSKNYFYTKKIVNKKASSITKKNEEKINDNKIIDVSKIEIKRNKYLLNNFRKKINILHNIDENSSLSKSKTRGDNIDITENSEIKNCTTNKDDDINIIKSNTNKKINNFYIFKKNKNNHLTHVKSKTANDELNLDNNQDKTFKFLIHQANRIEELNMSFKKHFLIGPKTSRLINNCKSNLSPDNRNKKDEENNENILNTDTVKTNYEKKYSKFFNKKNLFINRLNKKRIIIDNNKNKKLINNKNNNSSNSYLSNKSNTENSDCKINLTNKIINNNTYNTTLNFIKVNNNDDNHPLLHQKSTSSNYLSNPNIISNLFSNNKNQRNSNPNFEIKTYSRNYSDNSNDNEEINEKKLIIDLESLYLLEVKFQTLLYKVNKYQICNNECFDWISYYFNMNFPEKKLNLFKSKHNKTNAKYYFKVEILCFFLCYDISLNKNFTQAGILLKTIFKLLHTNFLILVSFIICSYNEDDINNIWVDKFDKIFEKVLKNNLTSRDMSENDILLLIMNNLKDINNYYKMIIDNLYSHYYSVDENDDKKFYKFPNCLKLSVKNLRPNQKLNIISLFFFDAYRLLNNYNFYDLKKFFKLYLFKDQKIEENLSNKINNFHSRNNSPIKSYLPSIKKGFKYTLVLDLDETLIYFKKENFMDNFNFDIKYLQKNRLIFRPGLLEFLHQMKQIYELVLFSLGTKEYVDAVLNIIEKNEKFFDHVLYRQHAIFEKGDFVKNLGLLGRDLKNVIIVDDNINSFKLNKKNGICIKAFYGDVINDKNTLRILGKILEKIRYDADDYYGGDITKSIVKHKEVIFAHITTNLG